MATINLVADFSPFPDDTVLGPSFTLSGFEFDDLGGVSPSFVNESGSVKGLQFERTGVQIELPVPVNRVRIRAAAFAGPFDLIGKDAAGATVVTRTVPGDNTPHTVVLTGPNIATVDCVGGGNEGVIITVSIKVNVC